LKLRKRLRKSAAEAIIVAIVAVVGLLTLISNYVSALTPFSQWFLAITPLAVAFATFYFSISIARDRRAREMAERVYTPLLKEVTTWLDPTGQNFGEWTKLATEARFWVRRIPKELAVIFERAYGVSKQFFQARVILYKLVTECTDKLSDEVISKAGFTTNDRHVLIQFMMTAEGYPNPMQIDPAQAWQTNPNVSEFIEEFAKKNYLPGAKWELKTHVSLKSGSELRIAGDTEDMKKWLGKVMDYFATQESAVRLRKLIVEIKQLGEQALLLIDEELG